MGKCDDGRVVWCDEYGTLEIIDCAPRRCDWVNNTIGHDCVN